MKKGLFGTAAVIFAVGLLCFNVFLRTNYMDNGADETTSSETSFTSETWRKTTTAEEDDTLHQSADTTSLARGKYAQFETTTKDTGIFDALGTTAASTTTEATTAAAKKYYFRNDNLFDSHYQKHGSEFGDISQEEYLEMANKLINSSRVLTKYDDDGNKIFYDEKTNEFLVLSKDGYIRTFFKPDDKKSYFDRQ